MFARPARDAQPVPCEPRRDLIISAVDSYRCESGINGAALESRTPAVYIGLVASAKRATAVLGYLRDRGVSEEQLARVHAPAGIDLGHIASEEIALAILAEIVRLRAAGELEAPAVIAEATPRHEEIDPVCGMTVDVADARYRTTYEGRTVRGTPVYNVAQFVVREQFNRPYALLEI